MDIDVNKKYITNFGHTVTILCTDLDVEPKILAIVEIDGRRFRAVFESGGVNGEYSNSEDDYQYATLSEITPYNDFEINEPVVCRHDGCTWKKGYFAGVNRLGQPLTFHHGSNLWSMGSDRGLEVWNECRRPTEEELKHTIKYDVNKYILVKNAAGKWVYDWVLAKPD